jgi:hypothetical protein
MLVVLLQAVALGAHEWDSCYGLFPPPAEVLGFESDYFDMPVGSGFEGNKIHYVRRKPVMHAQLT